MTENFNSISNTVNIVRKEIRSAPADTRVLGRLQQLEDSVRGRDEKLDEISQHLVGQEETNTKMHEKLEKISEQLKRQKNTDIERQDRQEESDRKRDEKLEKIRQQLASLMDKQAMCTSSDQTVSSEIESLKQKISIF